MFYTTTLPTLDEKSKIGFNLDLDRLLAIKELLATVDSVVIPETNRELISLGEGLESATIEGAATTIDNMLSDRNDRSTRMAIDSVAGTEFAHRRAIDSTDALVQLWKIITRTVCDNRSAGCDGIRTGCVVVRSATRIVHRCADPEQIEPLLIKMFKSLTSDYVLDAILMHFYIAYVHPFCDGNGRTARAVCLSKLTDKWLPLSKAISIKSADYYKSLATSEQSVTNGYLDISTFVDYMFDCISLATKMYRLYEKPLSDSESRLLRKIDVNGRGTISSAKASSMVDDYESVLSSLVSKGFLVYNDFTNDYRLVWR